MAAVGWAANPYLFLLDPALRSQGPPPELMARRQAQQAPQGFETIAPPPVPEGPQMQGGGTPGLGQTGPDVSGRMTSDERQTVGNFANPVGALANAAGITDPENNMVNSAIGSLGAKAMDLGVQAATQSPAAPMGALSGMLGAILGMDRPAVRDFLGWGMERNIMSPSPTDLQGLADTYGYGMHGAPSNVTGGVSVGPSGYGTTGPSGIAGPSVGNPDSPFGRGGDPGGQAGGIGGDPGSSAAGSSKGGEGPDYSRGGVGFARLGAKQATYGEKGPEKAIFVPDRMKKKGVFGKEKQVKKALKSSLKSLKG